ncbi:MAG TPA: bifunctional riboflavin kinase/FAD synthetase [Terriglobia bacterium]|nr:bifunctional riboflavin kinase/FAD synthetase [Terriglobia bacterium]
MKVLTSLADVEMSQPSVVSIGNFDGLHLGHRQILRTVVQRARELGLRSIAMTFSPHPIRFLAPDRAPRLISTLDQKIRLIENAGIDVLFLAQFDEAFSRLLPEDFIRHYLIDGLKARSVCVGGNFNFGYRGTGTIQTLRQFQDKIEIIEIPPVRVRNTLVSSSRIRELIVEGAVSRACRLLGRWVQLEGNVVSGAGRGRSVTVPTLNLDAENELIPKIGVYVTRISLDGRPFVDSITNVGVRPTFGEKSLTVETFVLGTPVPGNVASARLDFLERLRDEVKFESPAALRRQITEDIRRAHKFFRLLKNLSHAGHHSN